MTRRSVQLGAACALALVGCRLLVDLNGLDTEAAKRDAGADAAIEAGAIDAESEAANDDGGPCTRAPLPPAGEDFTSALDANWALSGAAAQMPGGGVMLNPGSPSQLGALWWRRATKLDRFEMTAKFRVVVADGAPPADGMAFVWLRDANLPALLGNGGDLGLRNADGFGVSIDTYANSGESPEGTDPLSPPFSGLFQSRPPATATTWYLHTASIPASTIDGAVHALRVQLDGDRVSTWLDDVPSLDRVAIPGYTPLTGAWGFVGATGGQSEEHWIMSVTASYLPGGGCLP